MSSLGDLLLAHLKPNKTEKVSDLESCDDHKILRDNKTEDSSHSIDCAANQVHSERIVKNDDVETQSTASSTDDYVRELLDPNDRPKNVWHQVEGPKIRSDACIKSQESEQSLQDRNDSDEKEIISSPRTSGSTEQATNIFPIDEVSSEKKRNDEHRIKNDDEHRSSRSSRHRSKRDRSRERSTSSHIHCHHERTRDDRHRDSGRDRDRDREHDRERERDRDRRHKLRRQDSDRESSRSRHRGCRRSRSRSTTSSRRRDRSRSNSQSPITKRNSRTILIMQLNPRVRSHDLEEFFSGIGRVKEVRLIMDSKTRRHKGIAYIEFEDASSASEAFSLNGQKFFGAPIVIQSAQTDRHRSSGDWHSSSTSQTVIPASSQLSSRSHLPPNCYRVYVGGLHVDLTEDMIRSVFEPFGSIIRLELMRDRVTNVSRGYAFITYAKVEDGQRAVQDLDGLQLGGKALRVSKSTDKNERHAGPSSRDDGHHDSDSDDRSSRSKNVTASLFELAGH